VIDAMKVSLDVTVQHRAVRLQPHLVRRAVDLEPLARVGFVFANLAANFRMKDLGAAARQ